MEKEIIIPIKVVEKTQNDRGYYVTADVFTQYPKELSRFRFRVQEEEMEHLVVGSSYHLKLELKGG